MHAAILLAATLCQTPTAYDLSVTACTGRAAYAVPLAPATIRLKSVGGGVYRGEVGKAIPGTFPYAYECVDLAYNTADGTLTVSCSRTDVINEKPHSYSVTVTAGAFNGDDRGTVNPSGRSIAGLVIAVP